MPDTAKINLFMLQFFNFDDVWKAFQPFDERVLDGLTHGFRKV
jgi:hypothetical protein